MNKYNFGITALIEDGHISPTHKHECFEIIHYTSCKGVVNIGNNSYKFHKGCVALIYPNTLHSEVHSSGGKLSYIGFNTCLSDLPSQGIYTLKNDRILGLMSDIFSEVRSQQSHFEAMLSAKISELLVELIRSSKDNVSVSKDISHIKRHIDENYSSKIDFNLLADSCGYSYSALRHKFKFLYGYSPRNYLVKVRLENAYELLQTGEFNCTEVCYHCGFSNSSQFSRMFKQKYNISPSEAMPL